jgi:hypothetical protein
MKIFLVAALGTLVWASPSRAEEIVPATTVQMVVTQVRPQTAEEKSRLLGAYAGCYKAMEGAADLMAKDGLDPREAQDLAARLRKITFDLFDEYKGQFSLEQVAGVGGIITARILHPLQNNRKKEALPIVLECGAIALKPDRAKRAMQVLPEYF